ncbi:MAG TPA: hypothetical protein VF042_01125 [Gemmatimonadaceae bacterium]
MSYRSFFASRATRTLCAAAGIMFATACDDLLDVSDPGSIQVGQLEDPALEQLLVNGVIGEFQFAYGYYALWSGVLADEAFTDHTNVSVREFSLHNFNDLNDITTGAYENIQRARQSADDASARLKAMLGTNASSSLNMARVMAYGGYSYVLLAEGFCGAPVNLSAELTPEELFTRAIARFDTAIAVATASKAGATAANITAATDIINMSNVGAARASLKKGDLAKAKAYASLVPAGYEKLVLYSSNSVRENNQLNRPARTADPFLGVAPAFMGLNDPRVPPLPTTRLGLNSNPLNPPQRPYMYVGWSPTTLQTIDITTNIKFATYLEAQYDIAEADGPTAATLAFVNARRAVGNQATVNLSGAELMAELRNQRARDFFLTGQRLGDLRRYAKAGTDLFPKGKYPVFSDFYGDDKCFVVPLSEKAGNPNYGG